MEKQLSQYIETVKADVASMVYSEGDGVSFEDKFTELCLENLENIGKVEGGRVLSYVQPDSQGRIDWKINAYSLRDEIKEGGKSFYETLELFICVFKQEYYGVNVSRDELTKSLNQLKKFLNAGIKGHISSLDASNVELIELLKVIRNQAKDFDRINFYVLTNGICNHQVEKVELKGYEDIDIYVHIWDLSRFQKVFESSNNREPIEIDFAELMEHSEKGIRCIQVPEIDPMFECYLAIIPGYVLSKLYKEFSNELLESNVRAFLGQAGKYNKGIRDTIREKPQMFLPYNNGITATADNVKSEKHNGELYITELTDFQIVNGGQTTASLYHTQKKYKEADLSKIFVQMKLTVIKETEKKNVEVPNIARYANSQNKVSELDLSSNNPFFVQIEFLSRKKYVTNPKNRAQPLLWYFERVNGQYRESLNKLLTATNQKRFKEQNPTSHKFVKSDIAKFINVWELEPHLVSRGSQKNFEHFTKKINDSVKKGNLPGENYYKKLIANAVIFKQMDALFGRKNQNAIGDTNLKSFTVAYSLAYFHYLTDNCLDLWKVYEDQIISERLAKVFYDIQVFVFDHLTRSSNNTLFSEYAKRESSWTLLKSQKYSIQLSSINDYLISKELSEERENEKEIDQNQVEDTIFIISQINNLGIKFWDGLSKYIDMKGPDNEYNLDFISVFDIVSKLKQSKNLTSRELTIGQKVLAVIQNNELLADEIRSLSKIKEEPIVQDVKAIYDRLKLLQNEDWKTIVALGDQTKIFNFQESSNLKSIWNSLKNKEKPKEQSLIKAFESVKKLHKYGIKL
jgi:hypothetical protein